MVVVEWISTGRRHNEQDDDDDRDQTRDHLCTFPHSPQNTQTRREGDPVPQGQVAEVDELNDGPSDGWAGIIIRRRHIEGQSRSAGVHVSDSENGRRGSSNVDVDEETE